MVFVSAVKGAGDTRFVMVISLIMGVVLATLSWLTIVALKLSIYGCWITVTVWVCAMGVIFLLRFLDGKWRSMRVIERQEERESVEEEATVAAQLATESALPNG